MRCRQAGSAARAPTVTPYSRLFEALHGRTIDFDGNRDRLADSVRDLVERSRLRVAARNLRNRSDVVTFLVAFDDHVELEPHTRPPLLFYR